MINLNEEETKQIESIISEIPGKYAIGLFSILQRAAQRTVADKSETRPDQNELKPTENDGNKHNQ